MSIYLTIFGKPRYLGLARIRDNIETTRLGWMVVRTSRGYEMGLPGGTLTEEQQAKYRTAASRYEDPSEAMLQNVDFIRYADDEDIENYYDCREEENEALWRARDILKAHHLDMKLVDVEYMLDRKKFFLYFTSEQRVDFRSYVRDLAHEFRTRIEMRQIGTRDEARLVKGMASCGRPCCCGYWLRGFTPISIKIVKEQRSALNPTKISGICGRLMCCMSYEQESYSELWAKLPGPGAKIKTEQGFYVLESLDIGHEQVNVRCPSNRLVPVKIDEFETFREAIMRGEEWGEDKELVAKKKAMQERAAMLEKRRERQKMIATAKVARLRRDRIARAEKRQEEHKAKPKNVKPGQGQGQPAQSGQTSQAGQANAPSKRRRNRKPKPNPEQREN
ncbi:MAG: hypothetical protein IJR85_10715 [Synergistaceae bacterium]|nr:hypothetical protein [Synergistaceae bacterium]